MEGSGGAPVDLMSQVARVVPVALLAGAAGMAGVAVADVSLVARAYLRSDPDAPPEPAADRAVARLVDVLGGHPDEATAARIGLLVQACDATAGLVGNTLLAIVHNGLGGLAEVGAVEAVVVETLRHDPPVRATGRVARGVPDDVLLHLDLAAANRDPAVFTNPDRFDPSRGDAGRHLGFGAGPHACPGREHAVAIAAGIVDAVTSR